MNYDGFPIWVVFSRYFCRTLRQNKMFIFGLLHHGRYLCKVLVMWLWIFMAVGILKVFRKCVVDPR